MDSGRNQSERERLIRDWERVAEASVAVCLQSIQTMQREVR